MLPRERSVREDLKRNNRIPNEIRELISAKNREL
jgi:hypothetical protein